MGLLLKLHLSSYVARSTQDFSTTANVIVLFLLRVMKDVILRQVLFDVRAGNSNLAKSLSEKSNHAIMYQDANPHRGLLSLQN